MQTRRLPFQSLYLYLGVLVPLRLFHVDPFIFGRLILSQIGNLLYAKVGDVWVVRKLGSYIPCEGSYLLTWSNVVSLLSLDSF